MTQYTKCDVCDTEEESPQGWLQIAIPQDEVAPVYDICSWDCMYRLAVSFISVTNDQQDELTQAVEREPIGLRDEAEPARRPEPVVKQGRVVTPESSVGYVVENLKVDGRPVSPEPERTVRMRRV